MSTSSHWTDDTSNLWDYGEELEKQHRQRVSLDKACLRLHYARPTLSTIQVSTGGRVTGPLTAMESFRRQGYNLSREVVGGALAMMSRPIQTKIMPVGADPEVHERCEQFSQLVEGVKQANRYDELKQRVLEDSMTCTIGAMKVFVDVKSEVRIERCDPLNVFWDLYEGSDPLTLLQAHAVPRRRLMAEYPEHAELIKGLPSWHDQAIPGVEAEALAKPDTVKVIEATGVKMGDKLGKRAIAVKGMVLETSDYDDEEHDIVVWRWDWDFRSFGGVSLVRGVAPYHCWTQRLVRMYYEQLKACVPVIWKRQDEQLFKAISDLEYQVQTYDGKEPPKIEVAGKVSADIVQAIADLRERCFQENGVSFQMATGQKPTGLNSAPAQREWLDTVDLRMTPRHQRNERGDRDVANRICRKAATAYKEKPARVMAPGSKFISTVNWKDIDLKEDQYQAVASVASGLSLTISGKIDQLEVLRNMGQLDASEVADNLKLPDTDELQREKRAPRTLAEKMVSDALKGKYTSPSPQQDLQKLLTIARLRYQRVKAEGIYPLAKTQVLRRLIRATEAKLAPPPPPVAPPASAAPALPAAAPAPAPLVSTTAEAVAPLPSAPIAP